MISKEVENLKETFIKLLNNSTSEILIQIIVYISKQITVILVAMCLETYP